MANISYLRPTHVIRFVNKIRTIPFTCLSNMMDVMKELNADNGLAPRDASLMRHIQKEMNRRLDEDRAKVEGVVAKATDLLRD